MLNIGDPATPEGAIANRAYKRLEELVAELELEPGIADMAHQVPRHQYPCLHTLQRCLQAEPCIC